MTNAAMVTQSGFRVSSAAAEAILTHSDMVKGTKHADQTSEDIAVGLGWCA